VAIADLTNANTITDRRQVEPIDGPLVSYFAARVGDYPNLRARATTKDDVDLGNLPNAKSDSVELVDSESLATSKAVATVWKSICVQTSSFTTDKVLTAAERGLVLVNASTQSHEITLPASTPALGVIDFIIRRTDNSENRLVVKASGTDRIKFHTHLNSNGYPFIVLMGAGDWWRLRSDGAGNWWPVGRCDGTPLGRPVFETTILFSPGGYGAFNGAVLNRAEWPWLWDHAQQSGMLTTEATRVGMEGGWTSGDGALTFRGPEGRGEFIRLLDEGRGVDPGRTPGSYRKGSFVAVDIKGPAPFSANSNLADGPASLQRLGFDYPNLSEYTGATMAATNPDVVLPISGGAEAYPGLVRPRSIAYPGRIKLI
jgi:hypothetical protein